jgi:hypothetical protein
MSRTMSGRLRAAAIAGAIVTALVYASAGRAATLQSNGTTARDSVRASLSTADTPAARQVLHGLKALDQALPGYKTPPGLSGRALADHLTSTFAAAEAARKSKGIGVAAILCLGSPTWFFIRSDQGGGYMRTISSGNVNANGSTSQGESKFLICWGEGWNPAHWAFYSNGTKGWMQPSSAGRVNANYKQELTPTQLFEYMTMDDGASWIKSFSRQRYLAASLNVTSRPVWATSPAILGWERWQIHT